MKRRNAVQEYMNELVPYGGEWWRRIDVIRHLEKCGVTGRARDLFLLGQDSCKANMVARGETIPTAEVRFV